MFKSFSSDMVCKGHLEEQNFESVMFTHPKPRMCRLTDNNFLAFAQVDEVTDGLRSGVAQDCIQHRFAVLVNNDLALVTISRRQDVANLFQQFDHGILQSEMRKVTQINATCLPSVDLKCDVFLLFKTCLTSVLSLGSNSSKVLKKKIQKEQVVAGSPW